MSPQTFIDLSRSQFATTAAFHMTRELLDADPADPAQVNGQFQPTNWYYTIFNLVFNYRFPHMVLAVLVSAARVDRGHRRLLPAAAAGAAPRQEDDVHGPGRRLASCGGQLNRPVGHVTFSWIFPAAGVEALAAPRAARSSFSLLTTSL